MKLKIGWEDFSKQIDDFIIEGANFKSKESEISDPLDLETLKAGIKEFNGRCLSFLKSSFNNENNEYAISFYNAKSQRFNLGNQQKEYSQLKKEAFEDLNEKLSILAYIKRILSVSDAIIKPDIVEIQNRSSYTTEQILELILEKLFDLYDNHYYSISTILERNGIILKRQGEEIELLETLKNCGYVNVPDSKSDTSGQLTITGKMYIEEKRKTYEENYEDINSNKDEISKRVDEVINQLSKLGLGQEIIFDELQELKKLYTTLNKKNWGQIVKGKLIDLALGKLVENGTISYIYETLTEHKLRLP